MYLTFYLVELLLFISVSSQETGADDPNQNVTVSNLEDKTTDENIENPITVEIESKSAPTELPSEAPDKIAEEHEDMEIKATEPTLEESTQAVEKRSGRTETATENEAKSEQTETTTEYEAKSDQSEVRAAKEESVITAPSIVSDTTEESSEFKDRALVNQDEKVTDSYETQKSRTAIPSPASHMNPNTVIDVKSRSGFVEDVTQGVKNFRRFDLGNQALSNIKNNPTLPTRPNVITMNNNNMNSVPIGARLTKSSNYGLINEMLPYYSGKPIEQYSKEQTNTYTMNPSMMHNRHNQNTRVVANSDSDDSNYGANFETRPIYNNNLYRPYNSYGNDQVGAYKPVRPEIYRDYSKFVPLQKRIPVQTISSAELNRDMSNRYNNERPSTFAPNNLGFSAPDVTRENKQKKPLEDLYRKLILEKYAQNYRPLNFQGPDLASSGPKLNGLDEKNPSYYPLPNIFKENQNNFPPYYQNPAYNYGTGQRSPG